MSYEVRVAQLEHTLANVLELFQLVGENYSIEVIDANGQAIIARVPEDTNDAIEEADFVLEARGPDGEEE